MKQKILRYAVMLFALGVFSYSSYELTLIYMESKESMQVYDDISNMFMEKVDNSTEANGESAQTDEAGVEVSNKSDGVEFVWDYDVMLEYNQEAKGYIRQGNGDYIDNPILQHSDNDYYLNHLANNTVSSIGSIYIDYRLKDGLESKNTIIYGHDMGKRVNNIMFGSLNWYYNTPNYYKEHPEFDIYIGYKHYKYYVFAIFLTPAVNSDTYQYEFASEESFMEYIKMSKEKSKYKINLKEDIKPDDKIITLSTCTGDDNKRMIVQLVRREQIMDVPNAPKEEETTVSETEAVIEVGGTN